MARTAHSAVRHPTVAEKDESKPFLTPNIDRAIIVTQYVLRSFALTQRFRLPEEHRRFEDSVHLGTAIDHLMMLAADMWPNKGITDPDLASYRDYHPFKYYLAMYKRLAACCDEYQEEAIQAIAQKIIRLHKSWTAKFAAGKLKEPASHPQPLTTRNRMGKTIIALARAFDIEVSSGKKKKK